MKDIIDDIEFDIGVLKLLGKNNDCKHPVYYDDFLLRQIKIIGKIDLAGRCGLISYSEVNDYIKQMTAIKYNIMELEL